MATTSNYGWTTPDDSDAVALGAAAIRSLGSAVDERVYLNALAAVSTAAFPLGTVTPTNGQYLTYGTATAQWSPSTLDLSSYATKSSVSGHLISIECAKNTACVVGDHLPFANGETDGEVVMAYGGAVLSLSIAPATAHIGTTVVQVAKNNTPQGTAYAVTAAGSTKAYTVFGTPMSFSAGDTIHVECTSITSPGDGVTCQMIVRFN